jgi:hypothetical protein
MTSVSLSIITAMSITSALISLFVIRVSCSFLSYKFIRSLFSILKSSNWFNKLLYALFIYSALICSSLRWTILNVCLSLKSLSTYTSSLLYIFSMSCSVKLFFICVNYKNSDFSFIFGLIFDLIAKNFFLAK